MTRRGFALFAFLAMALPALMTLDEKPIRWFLCAGGLEMGRGGRPEMEPPSLILYQRQHSW